MGDEPKVVAIASALKRVAFGFLWGVISFAAIAVLMIWAAVVSACSWIGIDLAPRQETLDD